MWFKYRTTLLLAVLLVLVVKCRSEDEDNCAAEKGRFKCALVEECLSADKVCNGVPDCSDGSDEEDFCDSSTCVSAGCSQLCLPRPPPFSATCYCRPGYTLSAGASPTCNDVDECATFGSCSQLCANTQGSYSCSCADGYYYRDPMGGEGTDMEAVGRCFAQGTELTLMFYATKGKIRAKKISTTSGRPKLVSSDIAAVGGVNGAIAVTYDSKKDRVYWTATDEGEEGIAYKEGVTNNNKKDQEDIKYLVKSSDIHLPEGIAIDYLARNIYFTDSHADTDGQSYVGVAGMDSGNWTKLITDARFLHKPRGVAVHPPSRLLFYTDWGRSAGVYRANTDGTGVRSIVQSEDGWINDLAVDTVTKRIYWVDAHSDRIETVDFDGGDRHAVLESMAKHPFYLETFEGFLYWTDWRTSEIHFCDKMDGSNMGSLYEDPDSVPMGISVHHSLLERTDGEFNACLGSECSFLCVLAPDGYACVCPELSDGGCVAKTVKVDPPKLTEVPGNSPDPLDGLIDPSSSSDVHSSLPVLIVIGILVVALLVAFFLWHRVRSRREARDEAALSFEPMRYSPQASMQTNAATVSTCAENDEMQTATATQPHFYYCNGEDEEEERGDQTLLIANTDRNFYQNT